METAIIWGKSKKDIQLLLTIAEKMGMQAKLLTPDDLEDLALAKAIMEGNTGELIDADTLLEY